MTRPLKFRNGENAMKRIILTLCVFIALATVANAEFYRCVDRNGNSILTDNPLPGAKCAGMGGSDESIPSERQQSRPVSGDFARKKAAYYFDKANKCVSKGGFVNTKKSKVYMSIGTSCLNAGGSDTATAFSYYDQAERLLERIDDRCRHDAKSVSTLCVEQMIEQAEVLKQSGDAYLGR